jgi:drug/metabolite transporter (DMT)-like permease
MPDKTSARWLLLLGLCTLTLIWGYSWLLAKQALVYAPPFAFAAERCFIGGLALLSVVKLTGRSLRLAAPGPTLAIGLAQVTAFMALSTWALVEGGPGKTAVLVFTMPIWTLLIAWVALGERVRGRQWLAAISTLSGMVLIIEPWHMHTSLFSKFLGVAAALCWATGTVLIKRLRAQQPVDLLSLTAWQMMLGSIPLLVIAAVIPEHPIHWTGAYVGILGFLGIISTGLCWWLWISILDRVPAWEASLSVLGTPVVAIASSRVMMGEEFRVAELAGIILIGGGLSLLALIGWISERRNQGR